MDTTGGKTRQARTAKSSPPGNDAKHPLQAAIECSLFSHKRSINPMECSKPLLCKHNSNTLNGEKRERNVTDKAVYSEIY